MYLFFDTETNGFPPKARMTQLAFILTDAEGNTIKEFQAIIKPDGWTVPKEKFFIDNNISTERCEKEGVPVFGVLREFQEALKQCKYKIAHNISFDNKIVYKEIVQAGITKELFQFKKSICTMLSTVDFVGALNKWGKPGKWPNLSELHIKCFNEDFDGAHDAMADVKATVKCFFECQKLGVIPKH